MKEQFIKSVEEAVGGFLSQGQIAKLSEVLSECMQGYELTRKETSDEKCKRENGELLQAFLAAKKIEGCSEKTVHYYQSSVEKLFVNVVKNVTDMTTNDIRNYLAENQRLRNLSKVTIDNLRRIFSSFFAWLEDEDYIPKSPVRRIHKVRTDSLVKEVLTDENIEILRDSCIELRDVAMIDLLSSTGMRVGELVKMNRDDIDFQERQCVVFGKGNFLAFHRPIVLCNAHIVNARITVHLLINIDADTRQIGTEHYAVNTISQFHPFCIKTQRKNHSHRYNQDRPTFYDIGQVSRIFQRMRRIYAKVTATVRTQLLDRNDSCHRPL